MDITKKYKDAYGVMTGAPLNEVKAYYVGVSGLSLHVFKTALQNGGTNNYVYYDGNEMWINSFEENRITQIGIPAENIRGDKCPFYIAGVWYVPTDWDAQEDVVFRIGVNQMGVTTVTLCDLPLETSTYPTATFSSILPTEAEHSNTLLPAIDISQLCHTWAVSWKLGLKIIEKVLSYKSKNKPLHACISARASNIGVEYFDCDSGEPIGEFNALSVRYGKAYIGRSKSWKDVAGKISFSLMADDLSVIRYTPTSSNFEFYFPRARVPMSRVLPNGTEINILGTGANRLICGVGAVTASGITIRNLVRRPYLKGYPIGSVPPKTNFEKNYEPQTQPPNTWTLIGDKLGDEDMTPKELETVKKWWGGYLQHLLRKGKTPTEEEVEIAKHLGVYTGN